MEFIPGSYNGRPGRTFRSGRPATRFFSETASSPFARVPPAATTWPKALLRRRAADRLVATPRRLELEPIPYRQIRLSAPAAGSPGSIPGKPLSLLASRAFGAFSGRRTIHRRSPLAASLPPVARTRQDPWRRCQGREPSERGAIFVRRLDALVDEEVRDGVRDDRANRSAKLLRA